MNPTKNDLNSKTRVAVTALLNHSLAALIDLQLQAKQAHWNVKGPNFISLHELFDSVAADAGAFADSVAERIVALGGQAAGTIHAVGRHTALPAYALEIVAGQDHVGALSTSMAVVGKAVRGAID